MAPRYVVQVANHDLSPEVARFIQAVEYESADGIADVAKITLSNPDFVFSDSILFQPGNEMNIYFGYGPHVEFVGRVQIARVKCNFPQDSMPRMQVIGYSKDHSMMDNSPEKGNERVFWPTPTAEEVIGSVATRYGFKPDIDEYTFPDAITQKAGLSDYDLCKGLANVADFVFWVDADESGVWTLHFVDGTRIWAGAYQEKTYHFSYGVGEATTLLEFDPEYALRGARTQIKLAIRNPDRGEDYIEIIDDDKVAPDIQSKGGSPYDSPLEKPVPGGSSIRLFFGEYSLEIFTRKGFVSARAARKWAEGWFRRQRDNFLLGNGTLIGVETLKSRETHVLHGLGRAFDGEYYFSRVRHVAGQDTPYIVDFTARKILPP